MSRKITMNRTENKTFEEVYSMFLWMMLGEEHLVKSVLDKKYKL